MIYLDTSVALAVLLAEKRTPPPALWRSRLVSSRLLECEIWTRIHARGLTASHGAQTAAFIDRVALVELVPPVLARAIEPFPLVVRTLDALHLASIVFLQGQGQDVALASYDERLLASAKALEIPLTELR